MAKSSLEKALEKYQKEATKNVKKKIQADKRLVDKQRRESNRQAQIDARRERAASIVNGQPTVGGLKIIDFTAEELVSIICDNYRREDFKLTKTESFQVSAFVLLGNLREIQKSDVWTHRNDGP